MAIFPNSLLRDLFQNNIDYVCKQVSRVLDAIYGEQATEDSTLPSNSYFYHTVEYATADASKVMTGMRSDKQGAVYSVDITPLDISIKGIAQNPYRFNRYYSAQQLQDLETQLMPYLASYEYNYTLEDLGIDHFAQGGVYVRALNSSNQEISVGISQPFGIDTNNTADITRFQIYGRQTMTITENNNPNDTYREVRYNNTGNVYGTTWVLGSIADDYNKTNYIIIPDSSSQNVYQIDNTFNSTTYNYNGDTVYNYYNDYGDIVINGGGAGISPIGIGGLAYVDIESIFDSLIDELNLQFNFGGDGETLPLQYAPTWDELHYTDRGSFYITPIQQLDTLPIAPDVADTVIDVSEPLSLLSDGFGALLSCFDSIGVTLTLTFTFLACLVINKIRGD